RQGQERPCGRSCPVTMTRYGVFFLMNNLSLPGEIDVPGLPVFVQDRPERLIEILAVLEERLAKQSFLHGAHLLERAVSASVAHRRACLQPVNADGVEREAH